jgi:hypothetical protein
MNNQIVQIANKFVNGKIYKLSITINGVTYNYYGSTIMEINTRKSRHDGESKRSNSPLYVAMKRFGSANFKISLVKLFPCNSEIELTTEETKIIAAARAAGEILYNKNRPAIVQTPKIIIHRVQIAAQRVANVGKHSCPCCQYTCDTKGNLKKHENSAKCIAKMPAYLIEQITVVEIQRMNDIVWD